jgi:predicted nuclease of predicted toxin-antitoxin system
MKFLADMGISRSTVQALRDAGHDAVHLREQGLQRLSDRNILDKARTEGRVVLTFDLDFGELLTAGMRDSPSVVIFRLRHATPLSVSAKLLEVVNKESEELVRGAVVIVQDGRYRLRRLPISLPLSRPPLER